MSEYKDIFKALFKMAETLGTVEEVHFYSTFCTIEWKGAAGRYCLTLTMEAEDG